jgi:hypothetical protein
MLSLQQSAGNQAVSRLLQRKPGKENQKTGAAPSAGLRAGVRDPHRAGAGEASLPHEAWHLVQPKQGRVAPTMALKSGAEVDDDPALTREAEVMGEKALAFRAP